MRYLKPAAVVCWLVAAVLIGLAHPEPAAVVCFIVAAVLWARAWWLARAAAKLREKSFDYRGGG